MAYNSKYTGQEVDDLLDKINNDNVGEIDDALSTTSENPLMNKVVTEELDTKQDKEEKMATSMSQTLFHKRENSQRVEGLDKEC